MKGKISQQTADLEMTKRELTNKGFKTTIINMFKDLRQKHDHNKNVNGNCKNRQINLLNLKKEKTTNI